MRWIFSAGIPIAHFDRKGLADAVFWRLWQRHRRAYRDLGVDDEVWLREGAGRHAVVRWRTRVREVLRHNYVSKTDAARVLARDLGLDRREFLEHPYTVRAPERGLLLAVVFEPVEELDVPFPDELRMPQDGFLPLDGVADSKLHA